MEMLNVGLLEAIVVDDWKAKMWVQFPNLRSEAVKQRS